MTTSQANSVPRFKRATVRALTKIRYFKRVMAPPIAGMPARTSHSDDHVSILTNLFPGINRVKNQKNIHKTTN